MNPYQTEAPPARTPHTSEQPGGEISFEQERQAFLEQVESPKIRSQIESLGPFPYDLQRLFPKTKGFGSTGEVKRRVKLLKGLEPRFEHLLYPGEVVEFATSGMFNSWAEQYFLGWWMAYLINRTVFVFTNYRVLLVNANTSNRPKHMQWQIPYEEIENFKAGGFLSSSIVFKLSDKKKFNFAGVPGADRKMLRDYVLDQVSRVRAEDFKFPHHQARDPLCPDCSTPVPALAKSCEACGEPFMDRSTPMLLALALPCLGEFYLGHWMMGMLELLGYGVMWIIFAAILAEEGASVLPGILIALVIAHVFDAALTWHVAGKGVILKRAAWKGH